MSFRDVSVVYLTIEDIDDIAHQLGDLAIQWSNEADDPDVARDITRVERQEAALRESASINAEIVMDEWGTRPHSGDIIRLARFAAQQVVEPWEEGKDCDGDMWDMQTFVREVLRVGVQAGLHPDNVLNGIADGIDIPWEVTA